MVNVVFDSGNTKLKLAIFENNSMVFSQSFLYTDELPKQLEKVLKDCKKDKNAILSTVKDLPEKISEIIQKNVKKLLVLDSQTPIPIKNTYETPETLGKDRLAGIIGANQIYSHSNVLVIDAGTAITFDLINEYDEYIGGTISPGLNMRFKALHDYTDKLPLLTPDFKPHYIGKSTRESILSGVQNGIIYEINEYLRISELNYANLKVILTGGDAFYFDNKFKKSIFAEPNLVLIGLNRILNYNA